MQVHFSGIVIVTSRANRANTKLRSTSHLCEVTFDTSSQTLPHKDMKLKQTVEMPSQNRNCSTVFAGEQHQWEN